MQRSNVVVSEFRLVHWKGMSLISMLCIPPVLVINSHVMYLAVQLTMNGLRKKYHQLHRAHHSSERLGGRNIVHPALCTSIPERQLCDGHLGVLHVLTSNGVKPSWAQEAKGVWGGGVVHTNLCVHNNTLEGDASAHNLQTCRKCSIVRYQRHSHYKAFVFSVMKCLG